MGSIRTVLVLDGQGGGVGSQLVKLLKPRLPGDCRLLCAGTNVAATSAMLKAGAAQGATGENAVAYGYRLLEAAGGRRGFRISGGEVDTERMAKVLLDEFRSGKLGRFTLELPS